MEILLKITATALISFIVFLVSFIMASKISARQMPIYITFFGFIVSFFVMVIGAIVCSIMYIWS